MSQGDKDLTPLERLEFEANRISELQRSIINSTLSRIRRYKSDLEDRCKLQKNDIAFLKLFLATAPIADELARTVKKEIDSLK